MCTWKGISPLRHRAIIRIIVDWLLVGLTLKFQVPVRLGVKQYGAIVHTNLNMSVALSVN